jgi:hypothetical protein
VESTMKSKEDGEMDSYASIENSKSSKVLKDQGERRKNDLKKKH